MTRILQMSSCLLTTSFLVLLPFAQLSESQETGGRLGRILRDIRGLDGDQGQLQLHSVHLENRDEFGGSQLVSTGGFSLNLLDEGTAQGHHEHIAGGGAVASSHFGGLPCVPREDCVREYGVLPTDVRDFGAIPPCRGLGAVRCLDGKVVDTQVVAAPSGPVHIVIPILGQSQPPASLPSVPELSQAPEPTSPVPEPTHAPPAPEVTPPGFSILPISGPQYAPPAPPSPPPAPVAPVPEPSYAPPAPVSPTSYGPPQHFPAIPSTSYGVPGLTPGLPLGLYSRLGGGYLGGGGAGFRVGGAYGGGLAGFGLRKRFGFNSGFGFFG